MRLPGILLLVGLPLQSVVFLMVYSTLPWSVRVGSDAAWLVQACMQTCPPMRCRSFLGSILECGM